MKTPGTGYNHLRQNTQGIYVRGTMGGNLRGAHWTDAKGFRYHVWFDTETWTVSEDRARKKPLLYKNPPTGVKHGSADDFRTRYLDASSETWRDIVAHVLRTVRDNDLIAEAIKAENATENERRRQAYAAYVNNLAQEAGPDLLFALKAVMDAYKLSRESAADVHQEAAMILALAAIEKAKPDPIELLD